jgi:GTP cyclohydrolase II
MDASPMDSTKTQAGGNDAALASGAPARRATGEIETERALAEARAGRPVTLVENGSAALVAPAESIEPPLAADLERLARGGARLALPAARLRRLGLLDRRQAGAVALPRIDVERVGQLALGLDAKLDAPVAPADGLDLAALELSALALLLPPMIVVPLEPGARPAFVAALDVADLAAFRAARARALRLVSRAPVPLEGPDRRVVRTEFVVFRGGEGMRDQVAIVVGEPDLSQPVAVRLHSACLTGDLFGSLKCDCGDQLRSTVRWMADNGGGMLLYLDQEGRGNGIANKMRAYGLQARGHDTYDADEILGFEQDQRHFDFAAEMLKLLGVSRVRVMTNNPVKIAALRQAGLDVVGDERVIGRPSTHNVAYLASKRDRAGHMIDMDALAAQKMIDD